MLENWRFKFLPAHCENYIDKMKWQGKYEKYVDFPTFQGKEILSKCEIGTQVPILLPI